MCFAIPGKIIKIENNKAIIDYNGVKRSADNSLIPDIKINDYVLVRAGFIIEKIDKTKAIESIKLLKNARRKNDSNS